MAGIVTIFGSSAPCPGSEDYSTAYECGRKLAEAGFTICNGGYAGTMEASARGAREAGGSTIGVTVSSWQRNPNPWIQQEIKLPSLLDRLMKLIHLGDAYVVLPGGTGTLLEFASVLELMNKDLVGRKPIVLVGDFWKEVVEVLSRESTIEGQNNVIRLIHTVSDPAILVRYLSSALQH
jgi:uncharacterized protein (TIGR00730 family)